jgi:hypothetical protein
MYVYPLSSIHNTSSQKILNLGKIVGVSVEIYLFIYYLFI